MILLLSGPVGAGKTSVAKRLVADLEPPAAYLEGDVFWLFIAKSERGRGEDFRTIMRAMLAAARHYARDGYDVVVDFTIPPTYLGGAKALLLGEPFEFVVLLPTLAICAERAARRSDGKIADYAPYADLYATFAAAPEASIVRDPGEVAETARAILDGVAAGRFRQS